MKKTSTYGLTHLAIGVHDLDRTLTFYTSVFDMKVLYYEKDFIQLTTPGAHDILVFEKTARKNPGRTGGIAHFGFRLREAIGLAKLVAKIRKAGGTIKRQGEFVPGSPYVFFLDLDGYEVEVWYEAV